jgi:hypothetical protein
MKYFFSSLLLGCLLFTSCVDDYDAPCRDQVIAKTFGFSTAQLAVMPYGEKDSLVYVSDLADTMYLYTSGVLDSAFLEIANTPNNPECPNDFNAYPIEKYKMSDSLSPYVLGYMARKRDSVCAYIDGSSVLELSLSAIGAQDSTYLDSVLLGNRMFYNVNKFTNTAGVPFYIHPTLGILQVMKDQKVYTLQRFNTKPWK